MEPFGCKEVRVNGMRNLGTRVGDGSEEHKERRKRAQAQEVRAEPRHTHTDTDTDTYIHTRGEAIECTLFMLTLKPLLLTGLLPHYPLQIKR